MIEWLRAIRTAEMPAAGSDKRRYRRYENRSLTVDIARPGIKGIIRTNPTAECLNFSRTGLQFDCGQYLKVDEMLVIDIAVDDIELRDLSASIVTCKQKDDGEWCYGARFCLEKPKMKKDSIHRNLLRIEEKLRTLLDYPIRG